jgi:hypothetical protein
VKTITATAAANARELSALRYLRAAVLDLYAIEDMYTGPERWVCSACGERGPTEVGIRHEPRCLLALAQVAS